MVGQAGDRNKVGHRIVAGLLEQDAIGRVRLVGSEHDDVAVGFRSRHLPGAKGPRRTRFVFDDERPTARGLQLLSNDAGKGIRRSGGRIRHHHADGLRWKRLGPGSQWQGSGGSTGKQRPARDGNSDDGHGVSCPRVL